MHLQLNNQELQSSSVQHAWVISIHMVADNMIIVDIDSHDSSDEHIAPDEKHTR